MWATSAIFKNNTQSKQSPIGRILAQSGHSDQRMKPSFLRAFSFNRHLLPLVSFSIPSEKNQPKL
jgi:hypothetical protein